MRFPRALCLRTGRPVALEPVAGEVHRAPPCLLCARQPAPPARPPFAAHKHSLPFSLARPHPPPCALPSSLRLRKRSCVLAVVTDHGSVELHDFVPGPAPHLRHCTGACVRACGVFCAVPVLHVSVAHA